MPTQFNLRRFVEAQEGVIEQVVLELRAGHKSSCWMWFVFPQIEGLGHSPTAQMFAISSIAEAEAYLAHQILGPRLIECTTIVLNLERLTAEQIFGPVDALKCRSSMTLFRQVPRAPCIFDQALQKYFSGRPDPRTLDRLKK